MFKDQNLINPELVSRLHKRNAKYKIKLTLWKSNSAIFSGGPGVIWYILI